LASRGALAFDLNAACSGWLYALEVGRALILAGTAKNLIVVTAELLSRITNPQITRRRFFLAMAPARAILTGGAGGHRLHRMGLSGDADQFSSIQRTGGGARMPWPGAEVATMDHFYLQMNGTSVFKARVVGFAEQVEQPSHAKT